MWNYISVGIKGLHFEVSDFISLVNFEWHSQNKVGNIDILVLWRYRAISVLSEISAIETNFSFSDTRSNEAVGKITGGSSGNFFFTVNGNVPCSVYIIRYLLSETDPAFPRGRGANPKGEGANLLFGQIFLKTEENCIGGGSASKILPCRSTTGYAWESFIISKLICLSVRKTSDFLCGKICKYSSISRPLSTLLVKI